MDAVNRYGKNAQSAGPLYRDPIYDGAADPVIVYNVLKKNGGCFTASAGPVYSPPMSVLRDEPFDFWMPDVNWKF